MISEPAKNWRKVTCSVSKLIEVNQMRVYDQMIDLDIEEDEVSSR